MIKCKARGFEIKLSKDAKAVEVLGCTDLENEYEVVHTFTTALDEAPDSEEDWGE